MYVVPSVIVKIEEDTTYIENKVFIEMPPIKMHPETPPEATSLSELQCQYCTKTLKNLQGLATHEVFCKDNPNRCKKGDRAREKPKLEEPETPIECQYCHKTLKNKAGHVVHEKHCKFQRELLEKRSTVSEDIKIEDVSTSLPVVPKPKRTRKSNSKFSGPNPHCSICKRVMGHWTSVRRHMQLVHERKINFTCEICGFGTYSQENLDLHKIKSHLDDPKPFVCDLCTTRNRFSSRSSILHHMRIHHLNEGKYICNMCSKKFLCKYSLESHIVTVHEGIRPYSCSHCDKTFKHAADVKVHRYKIHVPKERKPQMSCHFCDYVTHDKHSFTRHKVLHLDDVDKPFHCKFCNKGFPTLPNQVRHEKTHLDIRPFVCTFCEKAFRSKEDLKIHVRHHTGKNCVFLRYFSLRELTTVHFR